MPFPYYIFLFQKTTNKPYKTTKTCGKEKELDYTHNSPSCIQEKASASAFPKIMLSGSVTVEAVFCIPFFVYAAVCLIWMLELRAIQIKVRCALHEAGKIMSVELADAPILLPSRLEEEVKDALGADWISGSIIEEDISCNESYSLMQTGIMELKANYEVKLPVPFFRIPSLEYEESMRMKIWNGYVKNEFLNLNDVQKIVYVTETGIVYHKNHDCNYLEPSVHGVSRDSLESLRNEDGGKYHPCGKCGHFGSETYYVTDYGDRFHSNLSCSGIKRTIFAVPVSEVKGKGACSKCWN